MSMVFVGGSRHISHLPDQARERLDNIVGRGLPVVVGDAAGADKAVQRHLRDAGYRNVAVFCSGDAPRNNLGAWQIRKIVPPAGAKGFSFYAAKDREMAKVASFGLMIWDGESPGTALNVLRLVRDGRKTVLIDVPRSHTITFRSIGDWTRFIARCDPRIVDELKARATHEEWTAMEEEVPHAANGFKNLGEFTTEINSA